jgi:iron complex outermembrane receptor protein
MTLMADVQLAYNRYAIAHEKYLGNNFSLPYFFINPRVGLNYNLDEHVNLYSSIAYTSREPRLKNLYTAEESFYGATPQFEADTSGGILQYHFDKPLAKPERLFDFEIGGAYRTEYSLLSMNFFWMEFTDELIKSGRVDIFGQPVTGNADRTRHIGVELEGRSDLSYGFSVSGNASFSYNRLVQYSVADSISNGVVYRHSLDGNPIAGSPDYMAGIRLTQRQNSWSISADAKYVGRFYTDNSKNELLKNDEYLVFNLTTLYRCQLGSQAVLSIRAEVRNLFNTLYTMSGEGQEFFPAAERNYVFGIALQY